MNDDQFDDLKQFITTTVSQSEERLRTEMNIGFTSLRTEMQEGFAGVADAIETLTEHVEGRLDEHDKRIKALQQKAA